MARASLMGITPMIERKTFDGYLNPNQFMIDDDLVWPNFSVDLLVPSEKSAGRIISWATTPGVLLGAILVDPSSSFTMHADNSMIRVRCEASGMALDSASVTLELHREYAGELSRLAV